MGAAVVEMLGAGTKVRARKRMGAGAFCASAGAATAHQIAANKAERLSRRIMRADTVQPTFLAELWNLARIAEPAGPKRTK